MKESWAIRILVSALLGVLTIIMVAVTVRNRPNAPVPGDVVQVCPGEPGSHLYVLRGTYTVLLMPGNTRLLVPGNLGPTGTVVSVTRSMRQHSLSFE